VIKIHDAIICPAAWFDKIAMQQSGCSTQLDFKGICHKYCFF